MKILLIKTDLYKSIGGGQTVYRKIIEATPDDQFFYFRDGEQVNASRPANAQSIPLPARRSLRVLAPPPYASYKLHSLEEADRIARSVAGQTFDVADIPDFYTFGSALRDAFAHHCVEVVRMVLAMHGNITKSIELNWGSAADNMLEQRMLEEAQFDAADGIYAISPRYIREWQSRVDREIHYIDPAHFVTAEVKTAEPAKPGDKPSIYCIGRSERRKGNDLFVELVRWLKRDSFDHAAHVGDPDYSYQGISSSYLLQNIAKQRDIEIKSLPAMNREQLGQLYAGRSIAVLPVRYDSLNLVALEALFSGCPVAISSCAGVCDYLDEKHPGLPYVKIDFDNFYAAVADLQDIVDNYDNHRKILLDYLAQHSPIPPLPLSMGSVYQATLAAPMRHENSKAIPYEERGRSRKERVARLARQLLPLRTYRTLHRMAVAPRSFLIDKIKKSEYFGDAKLFGALSDAKSVPWRLTRIAEHSENNMKRLGEKLDEIYDNASNILYRCNFWLDIARIERILDNELMAVTYELRILRLLGDDHLGLLPNVTCTLNKHGLTHEAKALQAMYADPVKTEENVYAYLKEAYQRNLIRQDKPFQLLDDRRNENPAKVAVIVSLYMAAGKLNFFLTALSQQTLVKQGAVEIILVDSGSPTNEREVVEAFMQNTPLNAVYARSAERETIQAAWNRGIGLAKAPYLVFLGVDETLYPEGLEVLANELDQNPEVDWVMANSLVTAVEETGVYKHDIMPYDRTGATKDHTYLETCYLSWVGGMYRKTLHERFGYYDETFGAAGDTEIKNRILPYINVKFIPKMLGLFLNYPDGQTTASPKAEIEDLRAWYVHRTSGGVRYAFENRPIEEAEKQFCTALGYRKSYCGHMSSDIEYASYLAGHIQSRNPESAIAGAVLPGLEKMLGQLRRLEFAEKPPSRLGGMNALIGAWRTASQYQTQHREALKPISWPCYNVLNDNRYEQHSWLWKSTLLRNSRSPLDTQQIIDRPGPRPPELANTVEKSDSSYEILQGTPYSRYAVPIEYLPSRDFKPRYGYSKGVISTLDSWFESHQSNYRDFLKYMRALDLSHIPINISEGAANPAWIGGAISAFDSLALYAMVRKHKPKIYFEIGSGMTTSFAYQAIKDGNLDTKIISIDPDPRREIDKICDVVIRDGLEICDLSIFDQLESGDVLFLDGSHRIFMNSDVTVFFIDVLPRIKPGVIVHIHDILLPYDYPDSFKYWYWNEQYMLAVYMMQAMDRLDPILPTTWITRSPLLNAEQTMPIVDLGSADLNLSWRDGGSMWFTKLL